LAARPTGTLKQAMATREERAASNQTVFRAANEALKRAEVDPAAFHTFICECGDEACMTAIELTHEEYEGVRSEPHLFALAHAHEGVGDDVIEQFERFTLVEKVGRARQIAAERDSGGTE
jgi:hypothetical protein